MFARADTDPHTHAAKHRLPLSTFLNTSYGPAYTWLWRE